MWCSHLPKEIAFCRRMGLVFARVWRRQAVGIAPTERLKLRRQMAAGAGKKESVSSSLVMEANNLEVEDDLSTVATFFWAESVWKWKVQTRRQVREGLQEQ